MEGVILWGTWFSAIGFLHIHAQLCQDRFEYVSYWNISIHRHLESRMDWPFFSFFAHVLPRGYRVVIYHSVYASPSTLSPAKPFGFHTDPVWSLVFHMPSRRPTSRMGHLCLGCSGWPSFDFSNHSCNRQVLDVPSIFPLIQHQPAFARSGILLNSYNSMLTVLYHVHRLEPKVVLRGVGSWNILSNFGFIPPCQLPFSYAIWVFGDDG